MHADTLRSGKFPRDSLAMSKHSLRQEAERYLDGQLTLKELHAQLDDYFVQEIRYGQLDVSQAHLADTLAGLFAEYEVDSEQFGRSTAVRAFRTNLANYIVSNIIPIEAIIKGEVQGTKQHMEASIAKHGQQAGYFRVKHSVVKRPLGDSHRFVRFARSVGSLNRRRLHNKVVPANRKAAINNYRATKFDKAIS